MKVFVLLLKNSNIEIFSSSCLAVEFFFVFFCYCQFFYADTFFRDTENEITDTGIKHLCDGLAAVYENPRLVGFALLKKLDIRENLWTPEGLLPLFAHGHEHLTILTEGF